MCGSTGVQAPTEAGWRHPIPWSWSCLTGCWESHWDPSGSSNALTTKPSLPPTAFPSRYPLLVRGHLTVRLGCYQLFSFFFFIGMCFSPYSWSVVLLDMEFSGWSLPFQPLKNYFACFWLPWVPGNLLSCGLVFFCGQHTSFSWAAVAFFPLPWVFRSLMMCCELIWVCIIWHLIHLLKLWVWVLCEN